MPKRTGGNGEHVVTMREVAKAAGVSIKTVSNVVNDYEFVSQATRDKVNKAIVELGYTVNVSARNLRRGQTGIIGLAIPDLQMPYFAQLSSLVIEEAKKVGLRVIVEPTQYSRDGELEALHGSQQTMIDGLIYSPLELGQDDVERLKVDYPLVLVGERIFTDQVDHIATENVEGAKRATQYLLTTGCRRVAVVGVHPGEKVGSAALRYQGYLEALEEAGVEFDDRLVVESGMWHRSDGVRAMNALLDSGVKVDGVVALNDMLASGVMHAIQMHGLHIPDDISVVGFDNSDDSQYLSPALTSIAPGLEAVARLSVKVLKERIDGRDPNADRPGGEGLPQGHIIAGRAPIHQTPRRFPRSLSVRLPAANFLAYRDTFRPALVAVPIGWLFPKRCRRRAWALDRKLGRTALSVSSTHARRRHRHWHEWRKRWTPMPGGGTASKHLLTMTRPSCYNDVRMIYSTL
ncbi:MAG: LacI family DNA-binding transcriptional regulator [Bifidobacterium adolescentis]